MKRADEDIDDVDDDSEGGVIPLNHDIVKARDELNSGNPEVVATEPVESDVNQETAVGSDSQENNLQRIESARTKALNGQKKQAKKMLEKNKKLINSYKTGDLVLLHTDGIDRGAADAINILCVILEKKHELFKLGCEVGILDTHFPFNAFEKTQLVTTFKANDVPDKQLSVREAIRLLSVGHGQGVLKCNCKTGECNAGRCSCFRANQKCNSRCHGGCENKNCKNI